MLSLAEKYETELLWKNAYDTYSLIYKSNTNERIVEKLGWCASRAGLYHEAIEYFNILSQRKPKIAKWLYCIGYQYYVLKEWNTAIDWFQRALDIYPDYMIVKYRLGYSLRQVCGNFMVLKKKEFWDALRQFNECQKIWNNYDDNLKKQNRTLYADICFQKGKLLIERDKVGDAIISFTDALVLMNNDYEDCSYQLSKVYLKINKPDEALKILPTSTKYYIIELKIDIYLALNDINRAKILLEKHVRSRRKDYLYRQLAEIDIKNGDYKAAIQNANKAKEINKKNHLNRLLLAKALFEVSLLNKALKEVEEAIILKQQKYDSSFEEAEQLRANIFEIINSKDNYKDDIEKTRYYLSNDNNERFKGHIIQYNENRGYGFILSNNNKYFFHINEIRKNEQNKITLDSCLEFTPSNNEKGLIATNIKFL